MRTEDVALSLPPPHTISPNGLTEHGWKALLNELQGAYPALEGILTTLGRNPSRYSTMERFARYVVDSYEAGEREGLRSAFDIIERNLSSGTAEVQDAIVNGFLEDLQNIASHRAFGAEVFVGYLGIDSRRAWDHLNTVWEGKNSLADVVAAEQGAERRRTWWRFWRRKPSLKHLLAKVENPEIRALIEGMTREKPKQ